MSWSVLVVEKTGVSGINDRQVTTDKLSFAPSKKFLSSAKIHKAEKSLYRYAFCFCLRNY